MVCPHCEYEGRHLNKDRKFIVGKEGEFYKGTDRAYMYRGMSVCKLVGCPKCKKVFID